MKAYFFPISGEVHQMHPCQVSDEVDGTNHKTSHDGMFKVVRKNNSISF